MFQPEVKLEFVRRYCPPGCGWQVLVDIDASEEGRTGGERKSFEARRRQREMQRAAERVRKQLGRLGVQIGGNRQRWSEENDIPLVKGDRDIVAFHKEKRLCLIGEAEGESSGQPEQKLYKAIGQLVMAASDGGLHGWQRVFVLVVYGEQIAGHLSRAIVLGEIGISAIALGPEPQGRPLAVSGRAAAEAAVGRVARANKIIAMFPIRPVDQTQSEDIEYLGTKRKFWFTVNRQRFLFKAEERGTGEDWAEKVVCELAKCLGLPHVDYELAHEYEGQTPIQPGVICPTFVPRPLVLVLGNQLLYVRDPQYPVADEIKYGISAHTVEAVVAVVNTLRPPAPAWMQNAPAGITTALGVFVGYVMLDSWVANQDRHHQNWGAILDGGALHLAPTYDHGASLARNLSDDERKARLQTKDHNRSVEHFAARARSGFFRNKTDKKTLPTLDVFQHFTRLDPAAAKIWLAKLAGIGFDVADAILAEVPPQRMSPITRQFTSALLSVNQRRLLA